MQRSVSIAESTFIGAIGQLYHFKWIRTLIFMIFEKISYICGNYWWYLATFSLKLDFSVAYNNKNHENKPIDVLHYCLDSLISKLAKIGTFWSFLTTFGIEIVTRSWKYLFKCLISLKTINTYARSRCTISTTLIFSGVCLGKTQKLSFL